MIRQNNRNVLFSVPFAMVLRNFVATGLAAQVEQRFACQVQVISAYPNQNFTDQEGKSFSNHSVSTNGFAGFGLPQIMGYSLLDRVLKNIHMKGFAIEYPDGSLQTMVMSSKKNLPYYIAKMLICLAPRQSKRRSWLRHLYSFYHPYRSEIVRIFDKIKPSWVMVASPGHFWLDFFVLDEAKRRGIPSVCIVASWDNLYSRGPLCRRPDHLMVWSQEMKQQALNDHQFPEDHLWVVGALQLKYYEREVSAEEKAQMRARIGLKPSEPYLAYVCGSRTMHYDVEDVLAMVSVLRQGPYKDLRVVVRPHPQGNREIYNLLLQHQVLLDNSPDLTDSRTSPDSLNLAAIRHMASFLSAAEFVASSWGTTALLEACIFDTPAIQFRWMDSVSHSHPEEVQMVRDFQRYLHMRPFDRIGARLYCDTPDLLTEIMQQLQQDGETFRAKRRLTIQNLICLPLGDVTDRVCESLNSILHTKASDRYFLQRRTI